MPRGMAVPVTPLNFFDVPPSKVSSGGSLPSASLSRLPPWMGSGFPKPELLAQRDFPDPLGFFLSVRGAAEGRSRARCRARRVSTMSPGNSADGR